MKKIFLSVMLGLALCSPATAEPYQNPVIPFSRVEIADPFVLKYNGEYYMYASGDPIMAFHSRDLVNWETVGPVLSSTPGAWNEADVWAPEVTYRNGKFYMYYTASKKSDDWRVGEIGRRVGVAVSDSPRGPFVDSGRPLTPGWAIDGHVFTDREGQDWLFYSVLQEPEHPGAGIAVDRMLAPDKLAGSPRIVLQGDQEWEDKDADPNNGSLRYTNEGPTVIERDGKLYMFYSGGSWDRPTYAVGYATADHPSGLWTKAGSPILRATPLVDGPGHNALVKAPNNLDDIHFCHARKQPYLDPWNRSPFVDRLYWNGDIPAVERPDLGLQSRPDRPLFEDRFDGDELSAGWTGDREAFRSTGGVLRGRGEGVALRADLAPRGPYLVEANIRLLGGSAAGLRIGDTELVLDAEERLLRAGGETLFSLPEGFRTDAFHQLLISSDGTVRLDGVERGKTALDAEASPALWLDSGEAEFDGFAYSSGFQDFFTEGREPAGWGGEGGLLAATPDGLELQVDEGLGYRTKHPYATRYEFSATVYPHDRSAPLVARPGPTDAKWRAGVVAARAEDGRMLMAGFDKGIWPFGRFTVFTEEGDLFQVGLPRGFRYDRPHTVRVVRDEDRFSFFFDNAEIAATRLRFAPSQAGIFTSNVSSTFSQAGGRELVEPTNLLLDGGFESEQWNGAEAAPHNAWRLFGGVRANESSAHGGVRRLLFTGGRGSAGQEVSLQPGSYRLHAFLVGDGALTLAAGMKVIRFEADRSWRRVELDFDVEEHGVVEVTLVGDAAEGAAFAVDDVWLERRQ